jgi:GNAT-family acetyltransferase (TIGR03103 family)
VTTASGPPLPEAYGAINVYTRIIVDEALARGVDVAIVDAATGELRLTLGARTVTTVQSLSELTSALAFKRCEHKGVTRQVMEAAGLTVPVGRMASFDAADIEFLEQVGDVVVKPARGEQGWGITVGVTVPADLVAAIEVAQRICPEVVLEARHDGEDLRVLVIGGEVVAAAVRRPPAVTGDGVRTLAELIDELSRDRQAATNGASKIPLDDTTRAVVRAGGHELEAVLPAGERVLVRRTANLHTGGTIVDMTDQLHPVLAEISIRAAAAIGAPVLGLDLIVPEVEGPEYVIIEANEQPGLANHEPRPTAQRFVDLLFPETVGKI